MWKPSKKALFFLILISATLGGVSFSYVDWEMVNNGEIYKAQNLKVFSSQFSLVKPFLNVV